MIKELRRKILNQKSLRPKTQHKPKLLQWQCKWL